MKLRVPVILLLLCLGAAKAAFVTGPVQNVSNDAADSIQPRIAQGPDGNLHIVWVSGSTTREVRYAKGSWTGSNFAFSASRLIASVGSYGFSTPNLAVTSNNVVGVCWSDGTTLWIQSWPATNSVPSGSARGIGSGLATSLATDRSNRFHVVWSGDFDVHYCLWNGTACERSDSFGLANGLRPDIALDTHDNVHVVWDGNGIWYRNRASSGNWNAPIQLDTGGNLCQVASDGLGDVHIAWSRDFDIQYLRRSFSVVSLETRTIQSGSDLEPSVGATPSGRVLIGFRDATANKLRYVVRENGIWTGVRDLFDGVQLDVSPRNYFERISAASSHNYDIQLVTATGETSDETLVPPGSTWKFRDTGSDQGTAWRATNFNDTAWSTGFAQLGFGDSDEATIVNGGPSTDRFITTYFRHAFVLSNAPLWTNVTVRILRDDGAVAYLNGVEVFRNNMPAGAVTFSTAASTNVGGADETSNFYSANVNAALLVNGTNVLAVEVHQNNNQSSDMSFDLELRGTLRPVLSALRLSNEVRLAWSPRHSNYVLQSSALVGPNLQWSNVNASMLFTNGSIQTTLPATGSGRLFRLRR